MIKAIPNTADWLGMSHNNDPATGHALPAGKLSARAPWTSDARLVFLVGCPRSGTTWFQAMIASHPDVCTGPETQFFCAFSPVEQEYWRKKDGRCSIGEYLRADCFYDLMAESYWRVVSAIPEPERPPAYFFDKSPYHCMVGQFIARTFPKAKFIHLIRDARPVAASLMRISQTWGELWAPKTAEGAAAFWRACVQTGRLIPQFVQSPADQYREVRYEEVRRDPQRHVADLYEWLGLPLNEELVERAVKGNTLDRATQELFPSIPLLNPESPEPKFPEGHIGPAPATAAEAKLTPEDRQTVEQIAGDLLRELGYDV
jgi:hypothetical protein